MHPRVNELYQKLAEKHEMQGPFLEIGVGDREPAILSGAYFVGKPQRFGTNLAEVELNEEEEESGMQFIRCNSQDMKTVFADGQFGTVLSNAVLEHDKYFWRSLDEMKRVLAPGGILAVGAPAYIPRAQVQEGLISEKVPKGTLTMDVHSKPDYWRFSPTAFREVFCEGLELLDIMVMLRVPVIVAVARKPLEGLLPPVAQEDRLTFYQVDKEAQIEKRGANKLKHLKTDAEDEESGEADGAESSPAADGAAEHSPRSATREEKIKAREARLKENEEKVQTRKAKLKAKADKLKARADKAGRKSNKDAGG